jgi:two-component system, LytTR family, sensor kinase
VIKNTNNSNNFLLTLFGFEKAKSNGHILLIVLIHVTGWCLLFFLPALLYPVRINDNSFYTREFIEKSALVVLFYVNYYLFIPRFFEKKKYLTYITLVLLAFVVYFTQNLLIRINYFPRPGVGFQIVQRPLRKPVSDTSSTTEFSFDNGKRRFDRILIARDVPGPMMDGIRIEEEPLFGIPRGMWLITLSNGITSFALLLLMGGFFRLAYSFIRNQNEKKALENANLNAEVNFLKSQINPHFLFNTLNGIYSQAHSKSEHTEYSILKLSELLRYVLYDSGEEKVDLVKDISYLTNYIELQKIRLSQKVKIVYEVKGKPEGKQIAPLLLITFVENAFKHGISYTNPSVIDISIVIFEKTLTLVVSNPVVEINSFVGNGLGLKNVRRRLDLLYSGKYLLDIVHNDSLYIVTLKMNLNSD